MLSYHNDNTIKEKYLARVKAHEAADEIIHGQYWEDGKGCAVGCTIHSGNHAAYEKKLGLPEWLARLEDQLFEGMTNGDAKRFPAEFLKAIPVGVNLEPIEWKFCAFVLRENIERVLALTLDEKLKEQVISAIRGCLALHEKAILENKFPARSAESAARSAEAAARSAARSAESAESAESAARSAARSAAESAESAESAARSAESAARSAESAARSAESAARSAAGSAAYKRYADELLRLLKEA